MKKLLVIIIFLMSGICLFSQTVRPPLKTKDLQTEAFTWDSLLMHRDSLVYFSPIDSVSFKVRYPNDANWYVYEFRPDSTYISDLDIWIVNGKPITQGDSTFYVRQKPNCPNCWQYSYDNGYWFNWFCSETGASNLSIDRNARQILGIHYNVGLGAYTDSLYFKAIEADSGKVPMIQGDSVVWKAIPRDSLFDEFSGLWKKGGDTIQKQISDSCLWVVLDSTTIKPKTQGVNIGSDTHVDEGLLVSTSGNSITAWSGSVGVDVFSDSIGVKSYGQKIGVNARSANGIGVDAYSNSSLAINALSDDSTAINAVGGKIGINSFSQYGIAVNASSSTEKAIVGSSFYSTGVKGVNITGSIGVLGESSYAVGVKGTTQRGIGVLAEVTAQDGLPLVAQSIVNSPLVADFRGSQGIASNKLYLGGGTHEEKSSQLYIDGKQEILGSDLNNYSLLVRNSKGIYCESILRLGGILTNGVTYPNVPGSAGQILSMKNELTGILEFVDPDTCLWFLQNNLAGYTINPKQNVQIIGNSDNGNSNPTLSVYTTGTNEYLRVAEGDLVVDNDGNVLTTNLKVGSGSTITRSGTMAAFDIWSGTQAEWTANTPKDGIYPQATTTVWFIKD